MSGAQRSSRPGRSIMDPFGRAGPRCVHGPDIEVAEAMLVLLLVVKRK